MSTYVQSLAGASQVWPNAVDMLDVDKWCRTLADQLGVDPELIPSQEEADAAREQRSQQMQQTQQLDAMQKMASAAKDIPQVTQDQIMAGMTQYAG